MKLPAKESTKGLINNIISGFDVSLRHPKIFFLQGYLELCMYLSFKIMYCTVLCRTKSWVGHRCQIPKPPFKNCLLSVPNNAPAYHQRFLPAHPPLSWSSAFLYRSRPASRETMVISCNVSESAVINDFYAKTGSWEGAEHVLSSC